MRKPVARFNRLSHSLTKLAGSPPSPSRSAHQQHRLSQWRVRAQGLTSPSGMSRAAQLGITRSRLERVREGTHGLSRSSQQSA